MDRIISDIIKKVDFFVSIPLLTPMANDCALDVLLDTEISSESLVEQLEEVPFRSLVKRAIGLNLLGCALNIPFEESRFFSLV